MPPLLLLLTSTLLLLLSPSSAATTAEFHEPIGSLILHPLLQFLAETNSTFLINLHPYHILKINSEIPIGFLLFQTNPSNFVDDVTGARHRSLFDAIAAETTGSEAEDAANYAEMYLITHLRSGFVLFQTNPSNFIDGDVAGARHRSLFDAIAAETTGSEAEDAGNHAEMYLRGLIAHLRSGSGTTLLNEGILRGITSTSNGTSGYAAAGELGILYPNMTVKYRLRFSDVIRLYHRGWLDFLL